jgi:hypothetical protein
MHPIQLHEVMLTHMQKLWGSMFRNLLGKILNSLADATFVLHIKITAFRMKLMEGSIVK